MNMTRVKIGVAAVLLWAGLASARPVRAENAGRALLAPESRLWLEGNSTLHPFHSTATQMSGALELSVPGPAAGERLLDLVRAGLARDMNVRIAVKGLKSGKKSLDKNMYEAMKADQFPEITFRLETYGTGEAGAGALPIRAKGRLSIAGRENPVELDVEARAAEGGLAVTGAKEILMTDYGIKPPSMMMGAVKTDNKVVVHFDLILAAE